jgi:hypothetical protein
MDHLFLKDLKRIKSARFSCQGAMTTSKWARLIEDL